MSLMLSLLVGCAPEDGTAVDQKSARLQDSDISYQTVQLATDGDGFAQVTFEVTDERSFMVTAIAGDADPGPQIYFDKVYGPDGAVILNVASDTDHSLTSALSESGGKEAILNWPVVDGAPLQPGTYTALVGVGYYHPKEGWTAFAEHPVDFTINKNRDADPTGGVIRALFVLTDGLENNPEIKEATALAVAEWDRIFKQANLEVELQFAESSISGDMHWPGYDYTNHGVSDDQLTLARASRSLPDGEQLTIVVGDRYLDADSDPGEPSYDMGTLGMAGGIPGTIVPSRRTGLTVAWLVAAGGDGTFLDEDGNYDAYDIGQYAGTLAHEVGHYMGLLHPVELGEGEVYSFDGLTDTPECGSVAECETVLGPNLMFPYTVVEPVLVQEGISADQAFLMNHYTPVVSPRPEASSGSDTDSSGGDDTNVAARRAPSSGAGSATVVSETLGQLQRVLSHRHQAPSCESLLAEYSAEDLVAVTEQARSGLVQMRAAQCVLGSELAERQAQVWLSDRNSFGFATLVMQQVNRFDPVVGARLWATAEAGPHAGRF